MKVIETVVCKFGELSESNQTQVIENYEDINTGYKWWDCGFEDYKAIGEIFGIDISNVFFSGFSSQGDGACFEGEYSYNKEAVKKIKEYAGLDTELHRIAKDLQTIQSKYFYGLTASVKQSGQSSHAYCTNIEVYDDIHEGYYGGDEITELLRDFMNWIYRNLEKQYWFLVSDEAVKETIECNEYDFDVETCKIA